MTALVVDAKRLPLDVEAGAVFGLVTKSQISPALGGREARYAKQPVRVTASIAVGPENAAAVRNIFRRQVGPRWAFTVRDHSDYEATDEVLTPETDGTYPLTKEYGDETRPATRFIALPDLATLVVELDGSPATSGSYTISNGIITPSSSWATYDVTMSCEFFVPMRFANDALSIVVPAPNVILVQTFDLIEVI